VNAQGTPGRRALFTSAPAYRRIGFRHDHARDWISINNLVFNGNTNSSTITALTIARAPARTPSPSIHPRPARDHVLTGAPAAVTLSAAVAFGANAQGISVADSGTLLSLNGAVSGGPGNSTQASPAANTS